MAIPKKPEPKVQKEPEKRLPDFIARAKQSPESDFWVTIGAAWSFKNGESGFSVKLHTVPVNWDGSILLLKPLEKSEG